MTAILFLVLLGVNLVEATSNVQTERACEHANLDLSCEAGKVLRIKRAFYGRTNAIYCPRSYRYVRCTTCCEHVDADLEIACNNQQSCSVAASNANFGDPCRGTYKYLEVEYACVTGPVNVPTLQHACEHRDLELKCSDPDQVLRIRGANYGRTVSSSQICPYPRQHRDRTDCVFRAPVLREVRRLCADKNSCYVPATNGQFGDPCRGTFKYLEVAFYCGPERDATLSRDKVAVVCEHDTETLLCDEVGEVLKIWDAFYGRRRPDNALCPRGTPHLNNCTCKENVYDDVRAMCNQQDECTLRASNVVFGDPCVGTYKYLLVRYECIDEGEFDRPGDCLAPDATGDLGCTETCDDDSDCEAPGKCCFDATWNSVCVEDDTQSEQ